MNNKPLFLHHVIMHGIPNFESKGGRCPSCFTSLLLPTLPPHIAWPGLLSLEDFLHHFLGNLNFPLSDCSLISAGSYPSLAEMPTEDALVMLGTNLSCGVTVFS